MSDLVRQEVTASAHTVVVKVGTRVLTLPDGTLNLERIDRLADELHAMFLAGKRPVLVSSGAVGAGVGLLKLPGRPSDLGRLQAVAAIGQPRLMAVYHRTFERFNRPAAQVLLTTEDVDARDRYLNVRNTLLSILEYGAVPIINENDTVSVDELKTTFGDNDRLAAMVTNCLRAPLLVILSDVDGLYDGDPALPESKVISTVPKIDESVLQLVRDKKTGTSKGGMASKLEAARIVTTAGENVIIASGRKLDVLTQIMAAEPVGTLFLAQGKSISPFKRWIGFTAQTRGLIHLDAGAKRAIVEQGKSLLAAGVTRVDGDFEKGDVVALCDAEGVIIARGLSNYSAEKVDRIKGLRSERIAQVLGECPYAEVVHRDNLALVR